VIWLVWIVGTLVVVAVALGTVAVTSAKLANTPRDAYFDIEEAVVYVADRLPEVIAGRLSYDDVRLIVRWYLTYLRLRGVASYGGVDHDAERARLARQVVVAEDDEAVDELLMRAEAEGLEYEPEDLVVVVDLVNRYLLRIGSIAEPVDMSKALGPGEQPDAIPEITEP
jgi:hypothetical protein